MNRPFFGLMGLLLSMVFLCLMPSCDNGDMDEETGAITLSVHWVDAPLLNEADEYDIDAAEKRSKALDCAAAGVTRVRVIVQNPLDHELGSGEWDCTAHGGEVGGVASGTGRKVVVEAMDSSRTVTYRGEKTGITVVANELTHAGVINVVLLSGPSAERWTKDASGVVRDWENNLEWYNAGSNVNHYAAEDMVNGLGVSGGGWRMPTRSELGTLYAIQFSYNITPLLEDTGIFVKVWSGETPKSSWAWYFDFDGGYAMENYRGPIIVKGYYAFAVRSR